MPVKTPAKTAPTQYPRENPQISVTATAATRDHTALAGGRIQKVAIPQTIAQTRDNRIDTADHEYDPLSGSLVRSPEHRLHDPRRQKAAPQQPEAMAFNFAHGLLLHLVQPVFLAV